MTELKRVKLTDGQVNDGSSGEGGVQKRSTDVRTPLAGRSSLINGGSARRPQARAALLSTNDVARTRAGPPASWRLWRMNTFTAWR